MSSTAQLIVKRPHSFPHSDVKGKSRAMKPPRQDPESIPDDIVFDSQEFLESESKVFSNLDDSAARRRDAIARQERVILLKKTDRAKKTPGSLYQCKQLNKDNRILLKDLCLPGEAPVPRSAKELSTEKIDSAVLSINSSTAASYQFNLREFYRGINKTCVEGISVGDGATLIPNEDNFAGVQEFERSFLASPGVDPILLPRCWVENHYKWIVWKLASMDRLKFSKVSVSRYLTPDRVLKQLKYRYDREIDNSERSILRKILETDEATIVRMILCVSKIIKNNSNDRTTFFLELTDGWYSVKAVIDNVMMNYVICGKIKEGTKLMIHGAQIMNQEGGCHPLENSDTVMLKIHTNSTRRVKWYAKLGLQKYGGPMELSLKHINRCGGLIGKVSGVVSRVYPIMYRETLSDGEILYRNARSEEREQMLFIKNKESCGKSSRVINRDVKPCLKFRITDDTATGIVTIWQNAEQCCENFKEGNTITIFFGNATDRRSSELQINTTARTIFDLHSCKKKISYPARIFTPISETMRIDFNPSYSEFDTVGVVVSIGPAPHGMKNFETLNLAYRNDNNEDSFLSILFWQGLSSYGYTDIATIGSIICCMNCEWRRKTYRSIPTAFCSERTIITRNPRQSSHLKNEFDALKYRIGDSSNYVDDCAMRIQVEVMKKSGSTPTYSTPSRTNHNNSNCTPKNHGISIKSRLEKLQHYGNAPKLSPINLNGSSRVSLDFKSPLARPSTHVSRSKT